MTEYSFYVIYTCKKANTVVFCLPTHLEKSQTVVIKSWPQCCIIDVKLEGDSWNIPDHNAQVALSLVTATDRSKKCSATLWAWERKTQKRSDSLCEELHWTSSLLKTASSVTLCGQMLKGQEHRSLVNTEFSWGDMQLSACMFLPWSIQTGLVVKRQVWIYTALILLIFKSSPHFNFDPFK